MVECTCVVWYGSMYLGIMVWQNIHKYVACYGWLYPDFMVKQDIQRQFGMVGCSQVVLYKKYTQVVWYCRMCPGNKI